MRKITILGLLIIFASFTFGQVKNFPGMKSAARSEKMAKGVSSHKQHVSNAKTTFLMEDFENITATAQPYLPTGWTVQNVDANTVNSAYASYWPSWTGYISISGVTNSFASSCSYFQTPGTADRWLFSPAVTVSAACVLTWDARSIDFSFQANSGETYEVYATNTIAGSAPRASDFPVSARVYTTGGTPEPLAWTPHSVSLPFTTGTVYVAFRHTSNYKQVLAVDNIRVGTVIQNDLKVTESYLWNNWLGFTGLVPKKQVDTVYVGQKFMNAGAATQTNCQLNVKINNGTSDVFTGTSPVTASLAPAAIDSIVLSTFYVPGATLADYSVAYNASQAEAEETPLNNKDTLNFSITEHAYSRPMYYRSSSDITNWEAQASPITGSSGMMVGCNYYFNVDDSISKIDISLWNGTTAGVVLTGKLFLVDQATGDRTEVATTAAFTTSAITGATQPQVIDLALISPYFVSAGSWISAAFEVIYNSGMQLTYLTDTKSPNDYGSVFYFPSSSSWYWITNEFPHVAITTGFIPVSVNENNSSAFSIYPNPANSSLSVNLKNNQTSLIEFYNMLGAVVKSINTNNMTNSIDISGLNAGIYTVKVSQNGQSTTQKFVKQ